MTSKPVVFFGRVLGYNDGTVVEWTRAMLGDVTGHPVLDDAPSVLTSKVVRISGKNGRTTEIETLNTIYRLKE